MADRLTVDVDARSLIAALDRLGAAAEKHVKAAAKETALAIQREARGRAQWGATGRTREAITVEEAKVGAGYVVYVGPTQDDRGTRPHNLPLWLEMGTKYMRARPYLFNSARLEEGAHMRRLAQALQDAIDEVS